MASQAPPPRRSSAKARAAAASSDDPGVFGGYQPSFMSKPSQNVAKASNVEDFFSAGDTGAARKMEGRGFSVSPGMTDFLFGDGEGGGKGGGLGKTVRQPLATVNLAPGQVLDDEDFD